jgi:hypothetical protein
MFEVSSYNITALNLYKFATLNSKGRKRPCFVLENGNTEVNMWLLVVTVYSNTSLILMGNH